MNSPIWQKLLAPLTIGDIQAHYGISQHRNIVEEEEKYGGLGEAFKAKPPGRQIMPFGNMV